MCFWQVKYYFASNIHNFCQFFIELQQICYNMFKYLVIISEPERTFLKLNCARFNLWTQVRSEGTEFFLFISFFFLCLSCYKFYLPSILIKFPFWKKKKIPPFLMTPSSRDKWNICYHINTNVFSLFLQI